MQPVVAKRLGLAEKFYLTLLVPLLVISVLVTWVTYSSLGSNAAELEDTLRLQAKANRILPLLLTQDDASKALLIDPTQLEVFSAKKIAAYDEHKQLLGEIKNETKDAGVRQLITDLQTLDDTHLRPADTKILEELFENAEAARSRYFKEYEPHRGVYETKIRELARIQSERAAEAGHAAARANLWSLLQIASALVLGIVVVATTITILSRQVERSEENTKSLLAVLSEGLFFFDKDGVIAAERSESLARIIPGSAGITSLEALVTQHSPVTAANVAACLRLLWNVDGDDFVSDFESTITFLPKALALTGGRTISLEYRPLYADGDKLQRVVVVAADVTERLKNEREAVTQAERVRKISRVAAGLESYASFFDEAVGLYRRADGIVATGAAAPGELTQLKRDLHTLKGSIGTFEFASLAQEIHALESRLEEEGAQSPGFRAHWERIKDQWKFETSDIEAVLRLKEGQGKVAVAKQKFDRLTAFARESRNAALADLLADCQRAPLKDVLAKYESYLEKLAERDGTKQVRVAYTPDSCELTHAETQALDAAFVHIMRNSFDHGIETSEARLAARKPAAGTIHIACYRKPDGALHFVIKDDGQGVDGDKLARKAVQSGTWTAERAEAASYQDKVELVFVPSLSTKDEITETSGRGVGMDAVKALLEELGGSISIYSRPGQGTQFELDVPPRRAALGIALAAS